MTNSQKSDFKFVECKIAKTDFSLSDNDSFLRSIFQNQGLGYYPKTSEFGSKFEHKFYARNPGITSDSRAKIRQRKIPSEIQKRKSKIRFCNFSCFDFAFEFFTFSKKQQSKNSQQENELCGFSCPKPKKIMPVLADIQRVRAFIFCKRYFVPQRFYSRRIQRGFFYRSSFQSFAISPLLGFRLATACY